MAGRTQSPRERSSVSGFPPGIALPEPLIAAGLLAALEMLFAVRVLGQFLVAQGWTRRLPPMAEWYSGLIPYRRLLTIQLGLLALMSGIALAVAQQPTMGEAPQLPGVALLLIAWPYGLSMPVRYVVRMWRHPEARWTGRTIPIVFHVVLASWLLVLGSYLRPPA